MTFNWKLRDEAGAELRTTQDFADQAEAEAWLGETWRSLLDEGAESVALLNDGETVYEMGLGEA